MDAEKLKAVLAAHALWRAYDPAGVRANLVRANLYGANLYGANLYGANLEGANLEGASLYGANLYGANLEGASLYGANLYVASLEGANLYGANLYGANLVRANLYGANLYGANLEGASLYGANLYGANLEKAIIPKITPMQGIRETVLSRVNAEGCKLNMKKWHTCDTTHCLAGWIVTIHPEGRLLESIYGTGSAAALILAVSGEKIPNFYDTNDGCNERAMEWLKTGAVEVKSS